MKLARTHTVKHVHRTYNIACGIELHTSYIDKKLSFEGLYHPSVAKPLEIRYFGEDIFDFFKNYTFEEISFKNRSMVGLEYHLGKFPFDINRCLIIDDKNKMVHTMLQPEPISVAIKLDYSHGFADWNSRSYTRRFHMGSLIDHFNNHPWVTSMKTGNIDNPPYLDKTLAIKHVHIHIPQEEYNTLYLAAIKEIHLSKLKSKSVYEVMQYILSNHTFLKTKLDLLGIRQFIL